MEMDLETAKAKIAEFYRVGLDFDRALSRLNLLRNVAAQNSAMFTRWNDVMSRGSSVKNTIIAASSKVRELYAWVREQFGINLGIVWFIPIVLIGGIIAAIGAAKAWITEADAEARRLEIIAALPDADQRSRALATAARTKPPSLTENLSRIVMWTAIGAFAVFILPKLLQRK